eukprot:TRINITY_DN6510_c0_g1_i3.p2 TRINITY_DN6510_c0_g1~~TRINITY_DN6510_c0_g1_i3.p2  ORF type:complete len:262 (+),score=22.85 TRINITY_DN6510_c0_g1_i3:59-844(+)
MARSQLLLIWLLVFPPKTRAQDSPHILLVVVDDLGWLDVGFHNGSYIQTPVLNGLVRQGLHFDNYYGHSICTPSRASIMTSRFASHTGLQHSYMTQGVNYSLPLKFKTIADHLNKTNRYACHMVGKYHLGFASQAMVPTSRGFSTFLGYLGGGEDYYTHQSSGFLDFSDGNGCRPDYVGNYSTHVFANRTIDIIQNHNDDKQLFLYLPFQSVHAPLEAPARYHSVHDMRFPSERVRSSPTIGFPTPIGASWGLWQRTLTPS